MTKATGAAAKSKAAAAKAELSDESKKLSFRGLELTLPAKLGWRTTKAFADLQTSDGLGAVSAAFEFAEQLLGKDQAELVYNKFDEDEEDVESIGDSLMELFSAAFETYGTDTGESSASPKS